MNIILSYDLHGVTDTSVYKEVREDIENAYPQSAYILTTTYVINTSESINTTQMRVKNILDAHVGEKYHEFIVAEITSNRKGWLKESKWKRIREILSGVFR